MVLSSIPRRQVAEPLHSSPTPNYFPASPDHAWDRPMLSVLQQFFREWTEPGMMIGMGLGHLGWEAGRLLGFKGALSLGQGARAALWAGRAAGIAAEGATWTAATQTGRWLGKGSLSHPGDLAWDRAWAENSAFATTLRAAQTAFGKAGPWGMALGTYAGLVVSQQALSVANSQTLLPWTKTLGTSAALFANFYVSGTMARVFWGSSLARMEQLFLQKFHQTQALAEQAGGTSPVENLLQGNSVWAISGNPSSGQPPGRYRRPFSSRPEVREIVAPESGTLERPWRVDDSTQLLGHMKNPNSRLHRKIQENHLYFTLTTRQGYSAGEVTTALNELSYLRDIPGGRRVQIQFEDDLSLHHFTKLGPEFRFRERGRSTPPDNNISDIPPPSTTYAQTTKDLAGVRAQMDQVALRRPSSSHVPSSRPPSVTMTKVIAIPAIPPSKPLAPIAEPSISKVVAPPTPLKLVTNSQELTAHLQALGNSAKEKFFSEVLFNGPRALRPEELLQTRKFMETALVDSCISLHDPHPRRTYTFFNEGGKAQGSSMAWTEPKRFEHLEVYSLLELVRNLSFLRFAPTVIGPLFVDIRGRWRPWNDGVELEKFLNAQIHDPHPTLQIRQEDMTQTFFYDAAKRRWFAGAWK